MSTLLLAAPDVVPPEIRGHSPDRDLTTVGVLLAALVCLGLSAYTAFRLPPFFGGDERGHFAYTVALLEGELPTARDSQPFTDRYPIIEESSNPPGPTRARPRPLWVAYHPPLAYAVAAPAVWAAGSVGSHELPTLAFRLVNATAMAAGTALAGVFAAEVFPGRRGVAVAAAVLTAVVPGLGAVGGYAHTDGVGFALTTGCLVVSAMILRRGLSPARLAAASLVASAAMLTRVSAATAVATVVAAAVVAVWRHGGGVRLVGARAVGVVLLIGGTVAAAAGWFYQRNDRLYGSPTGDSFSLDRFGRSPRRGGLLETLVDPYVNWRMWSGLYGSVHPRLFVAHPGWLLAALVGVAVVGLGFGVARHLTGNARASLASGQSTSSIERPDGIGLGGGVIVAGFSAGVIVSTGQFIANGGGTHSRYYLAVVPVVSLLLARALAELPQPRVALVAMAGGLLAVSASQLAGYTDLIEARARARVLDAASAGGAAQTAAVALVIVGFSALLALLVSDWRRREPATRRHRVGVCGRWDEGGTA